jgi:hypothetical protein
MGKKLENFQTKTHNPYLCNRIITHLHLKNDKKDSLDGILLGLFPGEIDKISNEILRNLSYLVSIGKVQSYKDSEDKGIYRIIKDNY